MKATQLDNIVEVWVNYFLDKSESNRNLIMEHYLPIVKYTADRIYAKLPDKVELDDLISAGVFGLMDAIDGFDPERKVKFETYCTPRIRGSILDELRGMDWVPRLVRSRASLLEYATNSLESTLGRLPTDEELAVELDLEMHEFRRLENDSHATGLVSLSNKFSDSDCDKDVREIDIIEDQKAQNPLLLIQQKDYRERLTKGLTRAERLIIILYYYEEMTMKEIGATLDISESRISQLHASIIARLKAKMQGKEEEYVGRVTTESIPKKEVGFYKFISNMWGKYFTNLDVTQKDLRNKMNYFCSEGEYVVPRTDSRPGQVVIIKKYAELEAKFKTYASKVFKQKKTPHQPR